MFHSGSAASQCHQEAQVDSDGAEGNLFQFKYIKFITNCNCLLDKPCPSINTCRQK